MEFHLRAEIKRVEAQWAIAGPRYGDATKAMTTASLLARSLREVLENIKSSRAKYRQSELDQFESDVNGAQELFNRHCDIHAEAIRKYWETREVAFACMHRCDELRKQLDDFLEGRERWEKSDEFRGHSADEPESSGTRTRTFYDPGSGTSFRFTQTWPPPPPRSPPPRPKTPPPRPKTPPRPQESPSGLKKPKPFVRPGILPSKSRIDYWFHEVDTALANPSNLTAFPKPPYFLCEVRGDKCPRAALGLCECCIHDLFASDGRMDDLKSLRLKFHPDKFSRCAEEVRERVQGEAAEMFKVVDAMWRREEERKKEEWKRENERRYGPRKF